MTERDLANGFGSAILIDAVPRGAPAGTIYVIEPDRQAPPGPAEDPMAGSMLFDAHGMQPDVVLGILGMLGAQARRVLIVGCEPAVLEYRMELSPPVAAAVDEAVRVVLDLVTAEGERRLCAERDQSRREETCV